PGAPGFQVPGLGCAPPPLVCLPFAPALAGQAAAARGAAIAWVVYLGVMPTALGFATWSYALRRASAGRVASVNYLIPVAAIILGWAWLGERPSLLAVAGGGLCLSGVCAARRRSPAGNRAGSARAIRRTASSICRSPSGGKDSRRQGRGSPEKA